MAIDTRTPLAAFPDKYIQIARKTAPNSEQLTLINQYNTFIKNQDYLSASNLLANNPSLASCRFSTEDYNIIIDEIKATEIYFKEKVEPKIEEQLQQNIDEVKDIIREGNAITNNIGSAADGYIGSDLSTFSSSYIFRQMRKTFGVVLSTNWQSATLYSNASTDNTGIPENIVEIKMDKAFYYQEIAIDPIHGVSCFDSPIISPNIGVTPSANNTVARWKQIQKDFGCISRVYTMMNKLLFVCFEKKPSTEFTVLVKGR
ncbi:MAG: hypothetical protein MJZ16_13780 [Bacteroidales bacterium]|nr:hypothetical protein [Bacteroidales bacterium]